MEVSAIIISAMALSLSVFTFYWINIKEHKKFFLIRIDRMTAMMTPEFALINGGSKDILITSIECGFLNNDNTGRTYPPQTIEIKENDSLLIQAGKSFHCKVRFPEPFTSAFALEGKIKTGTEPPLYLREMEVTISWVETNGKTLKAAGIISQYGFTEEGNIRMHKPRQTKYDLYGIAQVYA